MAAEHTSKAATTAIVERASRVTVIVATAWFMLAAFWGIDGTPGGGHIGSSGSAVAMLGEHMIRWHT